MTTADGPVPHPADGERAAVGPVDPPEQVAPLGEGAPPPTLGAVPTWDWRSGTDFSGLGARSSTWEPKPYDRGGDDVPVPDEVQPIAIVEASVGPTAVAPPAAQRHLALPGAIAPEIADAAAAARAEAASVALGARSTTSAAWSSTSAARDVAARAASTGARVAPGTVVAARIALWVTAVGAVVGTAALLALEAAGGARLDEDAVAMRVVPAVLLVASTLGAAALVARRHGSARIMAVVAGGIAVVFAGVLPIVVVPVSVAAALLLLVPPSRPWWRRDA